MNDYGSLVRRGQWGHGDKFSEDGLAAKFIPFYNSGQRIRVRMYGEEVTGTVSATTGWRPSFMLMLRSNSMGSSYLLKDTDEILAVQHGKTYVPVANLYRDPNNA